MRTTVGPLPSAVYWRRRAVVLGAVLLGIIVLFVSCSGNDKTDRNAKGGKGASSASQYPTPAPASATDIEPSFLDKAPGGDPSLPAPGDIESQPPGNDADPGSSLPTIGSGTGTGTGQNTNVTAPADGSCADSELAVIPAPAIRTLKRGATLEIGLKIKNVGTRVCSRDVGAGPQELYLDQGTRNYWSSDTCSADKSSNVRKLQPGEELNYKVTWNGRQSSDCTGGLSAGPNPPQGQFELRARLGTLRSNPVDIAIVA